MQSEERRRLMAAMQQKKQTEPCNLQNATTQLQRYYMAHPVSPEGWKAFKANVQKMDEARPWRIKPAS